MPADNPSDVSQYAPPMPAAVRRAAARSDELVAQFSAAQSDPAQQELPVADPTTVVTPAEPAVASAAPASQDPPTSPPLVENWEQKYNTLRGKYDSERGRDRDQIKGLQMQLEGMERLVANMQASAPAPSAAEPPVSPASTTVVPKEDAEQYGEDLIVAVRRWARAEVATEIADLRNQIAQLSTGQRQVARQTTEQAVQSFLDNDAQIGAVWRDINSSDDFVAWLEHIDPFTGQSRKALLGDAYRRGDGRRCGEFFRRYQAEHTAVQPPAPAPHTPASPAAPQLPPAPVGTVRPTLAELAVPGRSQQPPVQPGAPEGKRVWTHKEISTFYASKTKGRYRGREAEADRIERDIHAAAAEGRVR